MIRNGTALEPGTDLRYLGDHIRFPETQFLNKRGEKNGHKFFLPIFDARAVERDGSWTGVPIAEGTIFTVEDIETGRVGKRGQPLPHLVILSAPELPGGYLVGITVKDLGGKFNLVEKRRVAPAPKPVDVAAAVATNSMWGAF